MQCVGTINVLRYKMCPSLYFPHPLGEVFFNVLIGKSVIFPQMNRIASHIKLTACDVMNRTQVIIRLIKEPMSITKYPCIRPRSNDLADEQVIGLLIVRLIHHTADQPADTAADQWNVFVTGWVK